MNDDDRELDKQVAETLDWTVYKEGEEWWVQKRKYFQTFLPHFSRSADELFYDNSVMGWVKENRLKIVISFDKDWSVTVFNSGAGYVGTASDDHFAKAFCKALVTYNG